jgi:hypothetical protein
VGLGERAQLGPLNRNFMGGGESKANLVPANADHGDADIIADDDFLSNLSAQH